MEETCQSLLTFHVGLLTCSTTFPPVQFVRLVLHWFCSLTASSSLFKRSSFLAALHSSLVHFARLVLHLFFVHFLRHHFLPFNCHGHYSSSRCIIQDVLFLCNCKYSFMYLLQSMYKHCLHVILDRPEIPMQTRDCESLVYILGRIGPPSTFIVLSTRVFYLSFTTDPDQRCLRAQLCLTLDLVTRSYSCLLSLAASLHHQVIMVPHSTIAMTMTSYTTYIVILTAFTHR